MNYLKRLFLSSLVLACWSDVLAQDGYATLIEMNEEILALTKPVRNDGVPDLSRHAVADQRYSIYQYYSL